MPRSRDPMKAFSPLRITSQPANKNYRDNYEKVFGKKPKPEPKPEKPGDN